VRRVADGGVGALEAVGGQRLDEGHGLGVELRGVWWVWVWC
jgi:hypothetical protein